MAAENSPNASPGTEHSEVPHQTLKHMQQKVNHVQEEQLDYLSTRLYHEIHEHCKSKLTMQNYLTQFMQQEQAAASAKGHAIYLNSVVHDLRTQLQSKQMEKIELEKHESKEWIVDTTTPQFDEYLKHIANRLREDYIITRVSALLMDKDG
jgi:hypothetical protein